MNEKPAIYLTSCSMVKLRASAARAVSFLGFEPPSSNLLGRCVGPGPVYSIAPDDLDSSRFLPPKLERRVLLLTPNEATFGLMAAHLEDALAALPDDMRADALAGGDSWVTHPAIAGVWESYRAALLSDWRNLDAVRPGALRVHNRGLAIRALGRINDKIEAAGLGRLQAFDDAAGGAVDEGMFVRAGYRWIPGELVEPGTTLTCHCAPAKAKLNACHRVVAAQVLANAGWRAVLDGEEVEPTLD